MTNNQQFISPILAPDLQKRQQENQMRQMYAKQMLEQSKDAPQGQMVSGHYVAPSWSQYLSHGLKNYLGNAEARKSISEESEINNQYAQMRRDALINALGGGQGGMSAEGVGQWANILGDDNVASAIFKAQIDDNKLTNEQKNLSHLPDSVRNGLLQAPFINEAGKDGMQMAVGEDGQVQAFPVEGYSEIQAANQGAVTAAQEGAKAKYDTIEVPTGDGGKILMSRDEAIKALNGGLEGSKASENSMIGRTPPDLSNVKDRRDFEKSIRGDIATGERTLRLVDRNIAYIDRLLANEDGLRGIVGRAAQFKPTLMMLDGELEANSDIDTIKSKVVLQTMEEMRKSSAAGATGFGNMNREQLKVIQDALGSLERAQTGDQIIENLQVIRNTFEQMRNDAVQDYDAEVEQYGNYLGRDFAPGAFGATRNTQNPSDILNRNKTRPSLNDIFGG